MSISLSGVAARFVCRRALGRRKSGQWSEEGQLCGRRHLDLGNRTGPACILRPPLTRPLLLPHLFFLQRASSLCIMYGPMHVFFIFSISPSNHASVFQAIQCRRSNSYTVKFDVIFPLHSCFLFFYSTPRPQIEHAIFKAQHRRVLSIGISLSQTLVFVRTGIN